MVKNELHLASLKGVGPKVLAKLQQLDIYSITDLLLHLPFRYEDHTRLTPLAELIPGEFVLIFGQVSSSQALRKGGLIARLVTEFGEISICFFKTFGRVQSVFAPGQWVLCAGILRESDFGYELVHPEWKSAINGQVPLLETHVRPVYRSCEGLVQMSLRRMIHQALDYLKQGKINFSAIYSICNDNDETSECLPNLTDAILYLHAPDANCDKKALAQYYHPAWQALLVDELLTHQLSLHYARCELDQQKALPLPACHQQEQLFLENLPFQLTGAQYRVSQEIYHDLNQIKPMQRLVQGDVGAGKTVIAVLAILPAVQHGQVALLAPLEVLATQHYQTLRKWLEPFGVNIALLSGRLKKKERERLLAEIKAGQIQLIIGTHALLQEDVHYAELNLVIIDEQHRFGVEQRGLLSQQAQKKGYMPHQLLMTATPIPRTLAMTLYADLDISLLDEVPKGRHPIKTVALANQRRDDVIARVRKSCQNGHQAYWVCTLIEDSDESILQAAEGLKILLDKELSGLNIGLVHGRMSAQEKNQLFTEFKAHKLDVLIATTVIEVGVDVPNASLMVIENPERLGLAQLHQLRGRVGRGSVQSYCVLMYQAPLSEQGYKRLDVLRESSDGFYIAEQDLLLRGPGDLLGARQTGALAFRFVDLLRDGYLVEFIKEQNINFSKPILKENLHDARIRWLMKDNGSAALI